MFNPVYTLEGGTMVEVERWRVRKRGEKGPDKGGLDRWSKVILNLDLVSGAPSLCHLLTTLFISVPSSCCTTPLLLSSFSHTVPQSSCAMCPISSTSLVSSEGKEVTQTSYFPWWSWGGQSWDTWPAEDSKSAVSGLLCVCECASLCV